MCHTSKIKWIEMARIGETRFSLNLLSSEYSSSNSIKNDTVFLCCHEFGYSQTYC